MHFSLRWYRVDGSFERKWTITDAYEIGRCAKVLHASYLISINSTLSSPCRHTQIQNHKWIEKFNFVFSSVWGLQRGMNSSTLVADDTRGNAHTNDDSSINKIIEFSFDSMHVERLLFRDCDRIVRFWAQNNISFPSPIHFWPFIRVTSFAERQRYELIYVRSILLVFCLTGWLLCWWARQHPTRCVRIMKLFPWIIYIQRQNRSSTRRQTIQCVLCTTLYGPDDGWRSSESFASPYMRVYTYIFERRDALVLDPVVRGGSHGANHLNCVKK